MLCYSMAIQKHMRFYYQITSDSRSSKLQTFPASPVSLEKKIREAWRHTRPPYRRSKTNATDAYRQKYQTACWKTTYSLCMTMRGEKRCASFIREIFVCLYAKHLLPKFPLCHHSKHINFDLKNLVQLSWYIHTLLKYAKTSVSTENPD